MFLRFTNAMLVVLISFFMNLNLVIVRLCPIDEMFLRFANAMLVVLFLFCLASQPCLDDTNWVFE
jgi:hypothetical protein